MKEKTIATFNSREQAEPLKQQLEQAHIHAEIEDETMMERLWFVVHPLASIRVKVPVEDYENAQKLMRVWDTENGVLQNAIRCPECGSSRIEYPQYTKNSVLPNVLGGVLSGLGLLEREFYCRDCQYTWPRKGSKSSRARPHQAPYYFIEGIAQKPQDERTQQDKPSRPDNMQHQEAG